MRSLDLLLLTFNPRLLLLVAVIGFCMVSESSEGTALFPDSISTSAMRLENGKVFNLGALLRHDKLTKGCAER